MTRIWRSTLAIAGTVILTVPVSLVVTFLMLPVWSAIERRWGIESVGHSGPATWCFGAVYVLVVVPALAVLLRRARRAGPLAAAGEGER